MMRKVLFGLIAAILIAPAPIAQAQPKFCDGHGTGVGEIYIHACATGSGGADAVWVPVRDSDGNIVKAPDKNGDLKPVHRCKIRCGGGRLTDRTIEPY